MKRTFLAAAAALVIIIGFVVFVAPLIAPTNTTRPPTVVDAPRLLAAGDIAVCGSTLADEETGRLLDELSGTVLTLGDNAYPSGSADDFTNCYDPAWGRHRDRTLPAPGNHDYGTAKAAGYFGYFGERAGDPTKGYYSTDVGDWHVVVLNSNCGAVGGCGASSAQATWLAADLRDHPNRCTLAAMHHPRFSTGLHGDNAFMDDLWRILVANNVDVVLAGHDHVYERFAAMDANGVLATTGGTRQFVVGTGGADLYGFFTTNPALEVQNGQTHGLLALTLRPTGYSWSFIPSPAGTFTDEGAAECS